VKIFYKARPGQVKALLVLALFTVLNAKVCYTNLIKSRELAARRVGARRVAH
jgi:hypothetical protein